MNLSVDLNADLGESFGNYSLGNDEKMLDYLSSVNIACGIHAGDPVVIRRTISAALRRGISIGAHPGYPDLQGFGRRNMELSTEEIYSFVLYQVGALKSMVEAEGGKMRHVKAHGALYNTAARDRERADAIIRAIASLDNSLIVFGLPASELENSSGKYGLGFVAEAFADRAYNEDGSLVNRSLDGALIEDPDECKQRVLDMVTRNKVVCLSGKEIEIKAGTICLHGDGTNAVLLAEGIFNTLKDNGVQIRSI